jgi:RimJ/RimL family protein N-acetyltransferase
MPLHVREMQLSEVDLRIGYFHDATDEYLEMIGADRARLPAPEAWRSYYAEQYARPLEERETYLLVWELDGRVVGFSSTDNIELGVQACMHLHILDLGDRRGGLGTQFVRLSAAEYFRVLRLQRLFCQPNAFNVAPNRTLQRAGFRYVDTSVMAPSPLNQPQPITRWVLEEAPAV